MLLYISIGKLTQYKADLVAYNGGDVCVVDDFDFTPFDCDTYMRQSCGIPSHHHRQKKKIFVIDLVFHLSYDDVSHGWGLLDGGYRYRAEVCPH